jgi:hypothetical protein
VIQSTREVHRPMCWPWLPIILESRKGPKVCIWITKEMEGRWTEIRVRNARIAHSNFLASPHCLRISQIGLVGEVDLRRLDVVGYPRRMYNELSRDRNSMGRALGTNNTTTFSVVSSQLCPLAGCWRSAQDIHTDNDVFGTRR